MSVPGGGGFRRIAAVKMRGLGDTILWGPALRRLKELHPGAELAAFCPMAYASLVAFFPGPDRVVGLEPKAFWPLVAGLRGFRPDLVAVFHASFRGALAARLSGCPARIVRNHSGPDTFGTIRVPAPKAAKGANLRDLDAAEASAERAAEPASALLQEAFLGVPASVLEKARRELAALGLSPARPPVVLCPGSSKMTTEWPAERWIGLARSLVSRGFDCILHVGPGEEKWLDAFAAHGAPVRFLRRPDLPLLAGILTLSRLCVASDSGPKHLAAAVGCPTLTIWGSTLFEEWHPYDLSRHPVVMIPVPCRPCFLNACGHLSCLRGIDEERVLAAAEKAMAAPGGSS